MNHAIVPIDEAAVNESFNPLNESFGGFREWTSSLFFQIVDYATPFFNSLLNGEFF